MVNEGFSCASLGSPLSAASYIIMLVPSDGRDGGREEESFYWEHHPNECWKCDFVSWEQGWGRKSGSRSGANPFLMKTDLFLSAEMPR